MERNVLCRTFPVSRATKQNAVAGAAYRAGENLLERKRDSEGQDKMHRYAGRSLTVREAFILTPEGAPSWASDRAELWNRVEETETRKNARVGREVQLGLAYELTPAEQRALVIEWANREFVAKGFVVDIAIHNYGKTIPAIGADDAQHENIRKWASAGMPFLERTDALGVGQEHVVILRGRNNEVSGYKHYQPHVHLRIPPRPIEGEDFAKGKGASREFDRHDTAMNWRYEWPALQNTYLERAGAAVRVRSTGSDEDAFPGVPRLPESISPEIHIIEQRKHELEGEELAKHEAARETEELAQEFNTIHNDTIRQAYRDERTETDDTARESREQTRMAAWWRNVSQRFNEWRFDFREQAEIWGQRFHQQKGRLQSLLGWHSGREIEPPERSDIQSEPPIQDRPEPERDR